jgi:hypothetical protein
MRRVKLDFNNVVTRTYGVTRGVLTLQVYCAREVTLHQTIITTSSVQIGVSSLYGERLSQRKDPRMGNDITFLTTLSVKQTGVNLFKKNFNFVPVECLYSATLSMAGGSSLPCRQLAQFTTVCTNAFLED